MTVKKKLALPAQRLAEELRRLRLGTGKTQEDVAGETGIRATSLSKIENMERGVSAPYLTLLIGCYRVDPAHAETLKKLLAEAREPAWWAPYRDIVPRWFTDYISLETAAHKAWTYESEYVPGLLQTRGYTAALTVVTDRGGPTNNVDGYLAVRSHRQQRLSAEAPLVLQAVLNEGALRRAVGGPDVMREQLAWLREVGARPNVTVQVLPFTAGPHPAMTGPFTVLQFPEPQMDTVYVEYSGGSVCLDETPDVDRHMAIFRQLSELALSERRTEIFLEELERRC